MSDRRTRRILVTGATGQVGWELRRTLANLGDVVALNRTILDLTDEEGIAKVIREAEPALVVNAAAYTDVDKAESEESLAFAINSRAARILAAAAEQIGAGFVHFSTDYVFDGTKTSPYAERDPTNPIGVYGRSKCDGEHAVLENCSAALVLRVCWVYGTRGRNFLNTIRRLASERDRLTIVTDQIGAPTWCRLIAEGASQILGGAKGDFRRFLAEHRGIYHLSCSGTASWHEFASEIVQCDGTRTRVDAISTAEYPTPAARPPYSVLNTDKLRDRFSVSLPNWQHALHLALERA